VARVRAVLRRFEAATEEPRPSSTRALCHGQLRLDLERHEASFAEQRVQLTATEFAVLAALLERPGVVLSRAQLLQRAYADDLHVTERTLDSHVRRIRAKFRGLGGDPIQTVHGVGYKASDS
jgi:two-component system OmpR family response regulator